MADSADSVKCEEPHPKADESRAWRGVACVLPKGHDGPHHTGGQTRWTDGR